MRDDDPLHLSIGDQAEDANSIATAVCDCPHVHLILYDHSGQPYARAMISPDQLAKIVGEVEHALGHKLPSIPYHPEVVGHG